MKQKHPDEMSDEELFELIDTRGTAAALEAVRRWRAAKEENERLRGRAERSEAIIKSIVDFLDEPAEDLNSTGKVAVIGSCVRAFARRYGLDATPAGEGRES